MESEYGSKIHLGRYTHVTLSILSRLQYILVCREADDEGCRSVYSLSKRRYFVFLTVWSVQAFDCIEHLYLSRTAARRT